MRLGCCGPIDRASACKDVGFEFLEVPVQAVLRGDQTDEAWAADAPDPDKVPLPMEAANALVPGSLPIVGPERDVAALTQYMQRVASRAGQLGIRRLVFGSGAARRRPEGVGEDVAMDQLAEFCRLAGDACAAHDVLLVIEHLNRKETNTINTLDQERDLMERVDHPAVTALVDSYHYGLESESDQALLSLGDRLRHVHVAEVVGRCQPGGHGPDAPADQRFDFEHFFSLLHKVGYDDRVSLECGWTAPMEQTGEACIRYLRDAWDRAGRG